MVVVGEFGRTPRINAVGGRNHWGHCFSAAFAGAGIRAGSVVGASDKNGAYPVTELITGSDFTARSFTFLALTPVACSWTRRIDLTLSRRPTHCRHPGRPTTDCFVYPWGRPCSGPSLRCPPAARQRFFLENAAGSLCSPLAGERLACRPTRRYVPSGEKLTGVFNGCDATTDLAEELTAVLAQEIRNARGGNYTFSIEATGEADNADHFDREFASILECRLSLIRFQDSTKDPREAIELGSTVFQPKFGKKQTYTVDRFLGSRGGGNNFSIGNGLGVRLTIRKRSSGRLQTKGRVGLRIHAVQIEFSPVPRDENNSE